MANLEESIRELRDDELLNEFRTRYSFNHRSPQKIAEELANTLHTAKQIKVADTAIGEKQQKKFAKQLSKHLGIVNDLVHKMAKAGDGLDPNELSPGL